MTAVGNRWYPKGRQAVARGAVDWETTALLVVVCDDGYTYDDAHENLDDVAGGARLFTFTPTGADATDGILDLDDHTEPLIAAGDTATRFLICVDTGVEATSTLLHYIDTAADSTPLAIATTGGAFEVVWPAGATKITRI